LDYCLVAKANRRFSSLNINSLPKVISDRAVPHLLKGIVLPTADAGRLAVPVIVTGTWPQIVIREASMYRSEEEKITDVMIGEAVLTLLKSESPISSNALIAQLEAMAGETDDATKLQAIKVAIVEVQKGIASANSRRRVDLPERDNHRLNNDGPPEGSKKH